MNMSYLKPLVVVLMGSSSDLPVLEPCLDVLKGLEIPFEVRVLSAHRTPQETADYVRDAEDRGVKVVVAAAGMAAHLAGACAAQTLLPVIGVPVASGALNGQDALLSTVMMPPGMPVATMAINGSANAAHLAAQILALGDPELKERLKLSRKKMREKVIDQDAKIRGSLS
jgi:5-(carboxyamino)imidazole ribonucleotide mutase